MINTSDSLLQEIKAKISFVEKLLTSPISDVQISQFQQYLDFLLTYNERVNLTAITDPKEVIVRHFKDSLTCLESTGDLRSAKIIDIGTGAGFPGVPLKIVCPDIKLTLMDSTAKKTDFLKKLVEILNLKEVDIISGRAEVLGQDLGHRSNYDWALARGVAALPILVEYLLPLLKVGGKMLAMKGAGVYDEYNQALEAVQILGGGSATIKEIQLSISSAGDNPEPSQVLNHYLFVLEKERSTPDRFPRRVGVPSKRPLI